jgi:hypothetical protein
VRFIRKTLDFVAALGYNVGNYEEYLTTLRRRLVGMDDNLRSALRAVLSAPIAQVNWAYHRAEAALAADDEGDALHTRLLYIIGNLQSWRGAEAREAKAVIKAAIKRLGK